MKTCTFNTDPPKLPSPQRSSTAPSYMKPPPSNSRQTKSKTQRTNKKNANKKHFLIKPLIPCARYVALKSRHLPLPKCLLLFVCCLFVCPPTHPGFRSYRPCGRSSGAILLATVPPAISTSSAEGTNTNILLAKTDGKRE